MFKVGDIVMAKGDSINPYCLTTGDWVGQVAQIEPPVYNSRLLRFQHRMIVETIAVRTGKEELDSPGKKWSVSTRFFRLA